MRLFTQMQVVVWLGVSVCIASLTTSRGLAQSPLSSTDDSNQTALMEGKLLADIRQLTFEGKRAGEGYFSADGTRMVFQSEREPDNPFFQIYLLEFTTGDVRRVSPGTGKTTCAWLHPDGNQVLFASTHHDPAAESKQQAELQLRADGTERRYAWDYDETYDLYSYDLTTEKYRRLTNTQGYDAEASFSPDGRYIVFASNRQAYSGKLTETQQARFEQDPSIMMDLYLMNADGTGVVQLTNELGYDGGPFFSPDGRRICWRRFSPDGATAEIMTMAVDGTDPKQLTRLGALSWAPFYHPSGQYLIFATNLHGFSNFELYLVDVEGKSEPIRVTFEDGFDGLPVFTPDGTQLCWTSNRTPSKQSQLFLATWNHTKALELLGLVSPDESQVTASHAALAARSTSEATSADCSAQDVFRHVAYLCRPELKGRRTGTPGEILATAYVAAYLDQLRLAPAGDQGTWFQSFSFTSGVSLGEQNQLTDGTKELRVEEDWLPLSFSRVGEVSDAPVVFAGYGIVAPEGEDQSEYDSYVHLDVEDKWVLVFRYLPENISPERRQHLARYSSLRFKSMMAREKGAHGLIIVSGPNAKVNEELVKLRYDGSLSSSSLPVISVSNETAARWFKATDRDLQASQDALDSGEPAMGHELEGLRLQGKIDIQQVERSGRNVLGRLAVSDKPTDEIVIVGAHIDHLGEGPHGSSLAVDVEAEGIHYGADDNASGVAAMLEIAQWLTDQHYRGQLSSKRDIWFVAWSGEEDGLIGASHFVKNYESEKTHGDDSGTLHPSIAACINLDMVGRLDKKLILQGVGSSSIWRGEIERRNAPLGLSITLQDDSFIPTDASAFYGRGVPILSAFTGSHPEYHTPRDTPDRLNYRGAASIAKLMAMLTRAVAIRDEAPDYVAHQGPGDDRPRANLRAYLGTVPDYAESDVKGVKLSAVAKNGPAEQAGVRGGDLIVELAGRKIENIYDYTYAIEALKIGEKIKLVVIRNGQRTELEVVPGSRE